MQAIQFIDTPEKLNQLCQKIEQEPWVALDTEFLREKNLLSKVLSFADRHAGMGGLCRSSGIAVIGSTF